MAQASRRQMRRMFEEMLMRRFFRCCSNEIALKHRVAEFMDKWIVNHERNQEQLLLELVREIVMVWKVLERSETMKRKKRVQKYEALLKYCAKLWRRRCGHPPSCDEDDAKDRAGAQEGEEAAGGMESPGGREVGPTNGMGLEVRVGSGQGSPMRAVDALLDVEGRHGQAEGPRQGARGGEDRGTGEVGRDARTHGGCGAKMSPWKGWSSPGAAVETVEDDGAGDVAGEAKLSMEEREQGLQGLGWGAGHVMERILMVLEDRIQQEEADKAALARDREAKREGVEGDTEEVVSKGEEKQGKHDAVGALRELLPLLGDLPEALTQVGRKCKRLPSLLSPPHSLSLFVSARLASMRQPGTRF